MAPPGSRRWAYVRVMAGTIFGGALGFYARMEERLRRYEAHMLAKAKEAQQLKDEGQLDDKAQMLPDSWFPSLIGTGDTETGAAASPSSALPPATRKPGGNYGDRKCAATMCKQ
ncbi:hypothetical protein EJB05_41587, partial [Eragrostis curvula]